MPTPIVQRIIQRSIRNRLLLCSAGVIALIGLVVFNLRYLENVISGPFLLSRKELLATRDPQTLQHYFVTLRGDAVADTGYQYEEQNDGRVVSTRNYLALLIDRHILLVETEDDATTQEFTGALIPLSNEVQTQVLTNLIQEAPEFKDAFLPMLLQTSNFRTGGYIGLVVGLVLLGVCGWYIVQLTRWITDPRSHPVMRALERFGPAQFVAGELESQLQSDHTTLGNTHLTKDWLAIMTATSLQTTRFDDVMWLHKNVTQHRVNGIPAGKTYAAQIWDRHGVNLIIPAKEQDVHNLLGVISQRCPWALLGYDEQLAQAWKANRSDVVSTVDRRRQQLATGDTEQDT